MRSVSAKGIHKSYEGRVVLDDVNVVLSEGSRLALIGENGSGKSTLLKILTSHIRADKGAISKDPNGCAYIAQEFSGLEHETPREFLNRAAKDIPNAVRLLRRSGFDLGENEDKLDSVQCKDLSGGEKKKLEIVAGLSSGSMFLALDEPENHLDYQTIEWLIGVLEKFPGGIIFVSHDHYLIDRLANSILELEGGKITVFSMLYESYLAEKERQVAGEARDWVVEAKTIKRLIETVEMMKVRAARNSDTAATYQQAKRRLTKLKEQHGKRPVIETNQPKVSIQKVERKRGKQIVSLEHVSFSYGNNIVFDDMCAELSFGEKVVLFGPNGSGKSTLINLIFSVLKPENGRVRMGNDIEWNMMTQNHLEGIDGKYTALKVFHDTLKWPEHRCRAYLARYGISVELVTRSLEVLSGGQQARFKLAITFAQEPEFLLLDEPTNHVDPPTWEAIVEAIKGYTGTVLAVTHDREFIDAVAEKLWVIKDHKVYEEPGNLTEYLERVETVSHPYATNSQ